MGPGVLSELLTGLPIKKDDRLLVGYETEDDACVYLVSDDIAIIQTVDFFPPIVDDPFDYGRIAAANALSDVYAMGAVPKTALNLLCFSSCLDLAVVRRILEGGADKCMEAGVTVAGGHSIEDEEPKFGLSVMGLCHPDQIRRNDTPHPGHILVLTKPLGTGALATGAKAGLLDGETVQRMIDTMAKLNRYAFEASVGLDVSASTDITGFGLLGHLREMAGRDRKVTVEIDSRSVPLLPGALDMSKEGMLPGGTYRNRRYVGDRVRFDGEIPLALTDLMFDPQTSGGLLLAMREDQVDPYLDALSRLGEKAWPIGRLTPWQGVAIRVI
ncbi:MAG TPA: selenide, water dikinase SelD [Bacillota bacterium]|nr:selenide, water dikinase SelD [Fastidiosipila sp.]HPX93497.1 selenide, water dikinase SelD [Bacillota bacterium]HQB81268.1 selenide, water dikinase SelD [Bacillota bacterium]